MKSFRHHSTRQKMETDIINCKLIRCSDSDVLHESKTRNGIEGIR